MNQTEIRRVKTEICKRRKSLEMNPCFVFLAAIAALYRTMFVGLTVCWSVGDNLVLKLI